MTMLNEDDFKTKMELENKFYKAIRAVDATAIDSTAPRVVKFMANEMSLLGEQFLKHTLEKNSAIDDKDSKIKILKYLGVLIEFEALVESLKKFQYVCSKEDKNELRVWLYNNNLFAQTPKYYKVDTIFIDVEHFLSCMKQEMQVLLNSKQKQINILKPEATLD